jgi:amino acid transporter
MAEEVKDAQRTIPKAICTAVFLNGIIGLAMMITVLYCLGDANSVLQTPTTFPFIQIFYNSVKSVGGAIGMSVVVLILTWGSATGITATASRMTWAFARDQGMPLSKRLSKVSDMNEVPIVAIFVVTISAALLVLIYIGSSVAFNDVISLTITGFYASYFLPCALLLYRRVKGEIRDRQVSQRPEQSAPLSLPVANEALNNVPQTQPTPDIDNEFGPESPLVWGPWRLPPVLGTINNAYACVYMIYVILQ